MAKPNYQYEKRQRDLAKKAKQEEKRLHKLAVKQAAASGQALPAEPDEGDENLAADDSKPAA